MDPYLEAHWRDVHASIIVYAREQIQTHLPQDLRARIEERVLIESPLASGRNIYPDVRVIERPAPKSSRPGGERLPIAEPLVLHVDEPMTESFIEIREAGSDGRVVSVIEILTLTNKLPGEGQDAYRKKQRELKSGGVSLVEVDLLRAGRRVLSVPPEAIPPSYRTLYQVCVRRAWRPTEVEIYRVPLREPLPVVPVPLREHDLDAPFDLQAVLGRCYAAGGYDDIDYAREPDPPLDPADSAWADALLREQGLR